MQDRLSRGISHVFDQKNEIKIDSSSSLKICDQETELLLPYK